MVKRMGKGMQLADIYVLSKHNTMVTFNLQRYFGEMGWRVRRKQGKEKNRISMKRQRREKGAEGEGYGKK